MFMVINIEDFVGESNREVSSLGGRSWNYAKLLALSDEDFAEFYFNLMKEYGENEFLWEDGNNPSCSECHGAIFSPKDLRKYYESNLHPKCFQKVYEQYFLPSRIKSPWQTSDELSLYFDFVNKYFERVSQLKISSQAL